MLLRAFYAVLILIVLWLVLVAFVPAIAHILFLILVVVAIFYVVGNPPAPR